MESALGRISSLGFTLPQSIDVVTSDWDRARNTTLMGDEKGNEKGNEKIEIILGPKAIKRDVGGMQGFADKFSRQQDRATAVIVHELCHVLHMKASPQKFWRAKDPDWQRIQRGNAPPDHNTSLGLYSTKNKMEFVAELFTHIVMRKGSPDTKLLKDYKECGGAMTPKLEAMLATTN